jgi:hypothetical protein
MGKPWFHTKHYGVGSGLPCSWEGWALLAVFTAAIVGVRFLPGALTSAHPWIDPALRGGLIVGVIALAWLKSDGPWLWRWGGK